MARERSRLEIEEQQNAARDAEDFALANAILDSSKSVDIQLIEKIKLKDTRSLKRKNKIKFSTQSINDVKKSKKKVKLESKQRMIACHSCDFKVSHFFRSDLVRHQLKKHLNVDLVSFFL